MIDELYFDCKSVVRFGSLNMALLTTNNPNDKYNEWSMNR